MNTWLQWLAQNGAQLETTAEGPEATGFSSNTGPATPQSFITPLTGLGLIAVTGDDAAAFLHNQLTNDVERLDMAEARLAGYCSPKGRLLATFLMWRSDDGIFLQLPRELLAGAQKRLQMFVLRAKAKLADVSDARVALGLAGHAAADALRTWFPAMPDQPYAKADTPAGTLVRAPDAFGVPRFLWMTDADTARAAWSALHPALPAASPSLWRLGDIHAGIPHIREATKDQLVPQMINFELIGGVNFKKGCYPGQEIVARSQYLGKLKRRMVLASLDTDDVRPGTEVFSSADPGQPCGMVVNAEGNPQGGSDCLVEIKLAAIENGTVHLGAADGPTMRIGVLPYPLPEPA